MASPAAARTTRDGRPLTALFQKPEEDPCAFTERDVEECLRCFGTIDVDKRGVVRLCDLGALLEAFTGAAPRAEEVFEVSGGGGGEPREGGRGVAHPRAPSLARPHQLVCDANLAGDGESNVVSFGEFVRLMTARKARVNAPVSDDDLLEAYVACGGEPDGEGCVNADILVRVIKEDFQLAIDIQELIKAVDEDGSGEIEFGEFKTLLSTALALSAED